VPHEGLQGPGINAAPREGPRLLIGGAEMLSGGGSSYEQPSPGSPRGAPGTETGTPSDPMGRFVSLVLGSTEVQWKELFARSRQNVRAAQILCGTAKTLVHRWT